MNGLLWLCLMGVAVLAGCDDKKPSNPNFAMLGDSIIEMMGQYQSSLPEPYKSATNLGVGGQTSTQIASRIGSATSFPMVLMEGGINNLDAPDQIVADYTAMLNAIPSGHTVFFIGLIQLDEAQLAISIPGSPLTNAKVNDVVARINAVCATHPNCQVQSSAQTGSMAGLTLDGLHPSQAGYQTLISRLPHQ